MMIRFIWFQITTILIWVMNDLNDVVDTFIKLTNQTDNCIKRRLSYVYWLDNS